MCYDQGQHCWDNECHNGTVCICDDTVLSCKLAIENQTCKPCLMVYRVENSHMMLQVMCNNPEVQTSSPHPETPGSGLECNYGWYGEHGPNPGQNLTTQVQNNI